MEGELAGFDKPEDGREGDDTDAEPSLGWTAHGLAAFDGQHHDYDAELDEADAEPSLANIAASDRNDPVTTPAHRIVSRRSFAPLRQSPP